MTKNSKICQFCKSVFLDHTKNGNKSHCGHRSCLKEKRKIYRVSRDEEKYKQAVLKFKQKNPNYLKEWRLKNIDHSREIERKYKYTRYNSDIEFKLAHNLRHRLSQALRGDAKIGSHVGFLGCSIEDLKKHLEAQFQPGMSWDNYGLKGWHVDHIIPLDSFNLTNKDRLKLACHYTNLQPLWANDNWSKGARYVTL